MPEKIKKSRLPQYAVAAVLWFFVWYFASKKIGLDLILPSPASVLSALGGLVAEKEFWLSCLTSVVKILAGWVIGTVLGMLIGTLSFVSKWIDAIFSPVLHIIKATPVASFIILALVLMKKGTVPSFIASLIVLPVVCGNTTAGLKSPDKKLLEMADVFRMPFQKRVSDIYLPALRPYLLSSAITTMGLAWKAGIAAEVICYPAMSIGKAIYNSKIDLDTPALFAWTIAVILLSVLFEQLIKIVSRLLTTGKGKDESN